MTLSLVLMAVLIAVGGGLWVFLPLWAGRRAVASPQQNDYSRLQEDVLRFAGAVRDLDMDFDMGKLSEADYATQRKLLIGRGVSATLQLQALTQQRQQQLEALIARHRRH